MTRQIFYIGVIFSIIAVCSPQSRAAQAESTDLTEEMKQSLVYLDISSYGYQQYQPWKHEDVSQRSGYGCAVGEYEVLTTAWIVRDTAFVKARRYGQNEYIPAKIKFIDYESNLCLIELDPNSMSKPLKPVKFAEEYVKGARVNFYWLSSGGHLYSGRGYLDRAKVTKSTVSYTKYVHYVAENTSGSTGSGEVYCIDSEAVGIACWFSQTNEEAGIIPAEVINRFLADVADGGYQGSGAVGFATSTLLDPAVRSFLKMPETLKTGVYVSDVYNLGTGSDVLKKADVILAIDGKSLNPYGRFDHPEYERLYFDYLIAGKPVGDTISFDVWRDGKKIQLRAEVKNFKADEMLVPYYEYDLQPEYVITAGFVFQKLTRPYMTNWGDDWSGRISPHLYHYYRDLALKPTDERRDIVVLSYVLPANINLGYKDLRQIVLKKFNGMEIRSIADVLEAQKLNPDSKYDVIEFEMDNPLVVIPRDQLNKANADIAKNYVINKLVNVRGQ